MPLSAFQTRIPSYVIYEDYLRRAYLFGTGTCEFFSIVGAYFLAREFDVRLSIETICSNESHTYIRLHTNPEYILDFWGEMVCKYDDNISWNEFFGLAYVRNGSTEFRQEIQLTSTQLIEMGARVFSNDNEIIRQNMIGRVRLMMAQELSLARPALVHNLIPAHGDLDREKPILKL